MKPQTKIAKVVGNLFKIYFPYNPDTVTQIRQLEGRKYISDGKPKYWTCPISTVNALALRSFGFGLSGLTKKEMEIIIEGIPTRSSSIKPIWPSTFKKQPYSFQPYGVGFLEAKNGRALIADEMGLGKTIQTLAYLENNPRMRPAVIVCPTTLKLNWKQEIQECMEAEVEILSGKKPWDIFCNDIIIINYDILADWIYYIKEINPKVIITDECHYYKSNKANRTKAVKKLAKGVPHFIALSGTPILNRPIEIYNAASIINPTLFTNFWSYANKYCGAKHNGFGWDFNGSSNTEELHEILTRSIMIRRKKKDVLKDLPDKVRSFIPFEINNGKEYKQAENNFITYIKETKGKQAAEKAKGAKILVQIEALKQLAVAGKMDSAIEWIYDFLETGEKLVIFAIHKFVITRLMSEFKNIAVKIDGSVNLIDRDRAVQAFQSDSKAQLLVGNIKAAGLGITLTAASNVAVIELPWTPGELDQAEDRAHRIGQKNSVNIHYLLAAGTIESDIAYMLDRKRKVLDAVLDGKVTEDESLFSEIMNKYLLN